MLMSFVVVALAALSAPAGQQTNTDAAMSLGQVRIPLAVLSNGQPLPAGTYELRLGTGAPTPNVGQSPDAQRRVEFVNGGTVVARDVAEVLRDDDRPPVGASTQPAADGIRVDLLKGGEFIRVSAKRGGTRYLVHLPVAR